MNTVTCMEVVSKFGVGRTVIIYTDNSFKKTQIQKVNFQVDEGGYIVSYTTEYGELFENTSVILSINDYSQLWYENGYECRIAGSTGVFKAIKMDRYCFLKIDSIMLPIDESAVIFI